MFSHEQYDALTGGAGFLDRSGRGRLRLRGPDRLTYLQGLLTNDVARLDPGTGCYAALLTPQGRMTSDMRVSELGDAVLVDLPGATLELVRPRLADFIFTEDVEVEDVTGMVGQVGVYGPRAVTVLANALPGTLDDIERRLSAIVLDQNVAGAFDGSPVVFVASDDYGVRGFDVFVDAARVDALKEALRRAGAREVSADAADVTRIEAGRPQFGADMDEHTIPLEAGIEDRAISLTKGCYVGQEIIIRVLHRGQGRVARRLVGLVGAHEDGRLQRGDRLQRDGRDVGQVTSAALSPRLGGRPIALGYAHRDFVEPGTALQSVRDGIEPRPVTVVALPFSPSAPG
jgi:tRNA-modifying protein YgfZ